MSFLIWVLVFFVMIWAGMAVFFIYRFTTYKHDFILKKPQGNSYVALKTRAKEYKDKSGATFWKLLKFYKEPIPVPPKESLAINKKGKFYVEGWLLEDGQMQYEKHVEPTAVDISTTNQKILLANQLSKAQSEKYKNWKELMGQYILQLGPTLILGMVVVMILIFWGDIAQPVMDARQIDTNQMNIQTEQLKLLKEINSNIQIIDEVQEVRSEVDKPIE